MISRWQQERMEATDALPAPGRPEVTIGSEKYRTTKLRSEFAAYYRVRSYRQSDRNFYDLIRSGDQLPLGRRKEWEPRFSRWICTSKLFDHYEVWGAMGSPRILVGHPYPTSVREKDLWILDTFRSYGLDVEIKGAEHSYYGFGTVQYLVFARGFLDIVRRLNEAYLEDHPLPKRVTPLSYPAPQPEDVIRGLMQLAGIRDGLTTTQVMDQLRNDPGNLHADFRRTLMGWSPDPRKPPSVRTIGRRLGMMPRTVVDGFMLFHWINGHGLAVWRIQDVSVLIDESDSADPGLR